MSKPLWSGQTEISVWQSLKFCDNSTILSFNAGQRSAVISVSVSRASGPGFDTWSGHILSFLILLIQEGQLSVTGQSLRRSKPSQEKLG